MQTSKTVEFKNEDTISRRDKHQLYSKWQDFSRSNFEFETMTPELFEFLVIDCGFDHKEETFGDIAMFWVHYFHESLEQTRYFIDYLAHSDLARPSRTRMPGDPLADLKRAVQQDVQLHYDRLVACLEDLEQDFLETKQASEIQRWLDEGETLPIKLRQSRIRRYINLIEIRRQAQSGTDFQTDEVRQHLLDILSEIAAGKDPSDQITDLERRFTTEADLVDLYAQAGPFAHMHVDDHDLILSPVVYVTAKMRAKLAMCFKREIISTQLPKLKEVLLNGKPGRLIQQYPLFARLVHLRRQAAAQAAQNGFRPAYEYRQQHANGHTTTTAQAMKDWDPVLARARLSQNGTGRPLSAHTTSQAANHAQQTHD
jgi:hypothetical protein